MYSIDILQSSNWKWFKLSKRHYFAMFNIKFCIKNAWTAWSCRLCMKSSLKIKHKFVAIFACPRSVYTYLSVSRIRIQFSGNVSALRKMDNFEFNRNIQLVVVRDNFSFCVFIVGIPIVFHDSTFAKDRQNVWRTKRCWTLSGLAKWIHLIWTTMFLSIFASPKQPIGMF